MCKKETGNARELYVFIVSGDLSPAVSSHQGEESKSLDFGQLEMGFILWTYTSQLAVVAFSAALRVNLSPSLT